MVALSSSISAEVSKMSCQEYKGYKWQCLKTYNNTVSRNKKFCVDQVTPPPPREGQGVAQDNGGGVQTTIRVCLAATRLLSATEFNRTHPS